MQTLISRVFNMLRRLFGFGDPPPGWWIETNGRQWRWAHPGHAWTFTRSTRAAAVREAWSRYYYDKAYDERLKSLHTFHRETDNKVDGFEKG